MRGPPPAAIMRRATKNEVAIVEGAVGVGDLSGAATEGCSTARTSVRDNRAPRALRHVVPIAMCGKCTPYFPVTLLHKMCRLAFPCSYGGRYRISVL